MTLGLPVYVLSNRLPSKYQVWEKEYGLRRGSENVWLTGGTVVRS
jgi:hypothetical protein